MNTGRRSLLISMTGAFASFFLRARQRPFPRGLLKLGEALDRTLYRRMIEIASGGQNELTLTVPATSMRDRADAFRAQLIQEYLDPKKKFPIFQAMFLANIMPTNLDAARKMGATASGPRFLNISGDNPGVRSLFNDDGIPDFDAKFTADVNSQPIGFAITFPKTLQATVTYDSKGIIFTIASRVLLKLDDKLVFNGQPLPIPQRLLMTRISLSAAALEYEMQEDGGSQSKVTIILDFSSPPHTGRAGWGKSTLASIGCLLGVMALGCVICASSCVNNRGGQSVSRHTCLDDKVTDQKDLEHIVRCYNDSSIVNGIVQANGKSFIRDGSFVGSGSCPTTPPPPPTPPNLNEFSFVRYDQVNIGCSLKICANVDPPPGWISLQPFPDDKGCDVQPGQTANFNNVKLITRQQ